MRIQGGSLRTSQWPRTRGLVADLALKTGRVKDYHLIPSHCWVRYEAVSFGRGHLNPRPSSRLTTPSAICRVSTSQEDLGNFVWPPVSADEAQRAKYWHEVRIKVSDYAEQLLVVYTVGLSNYGKTSSHRLAAYFSSVQPFRQ